MADTENRGRNTGQQEQTGLTGVVVTVSEKAKDMAGSVASRAEDAWDSTRQGVQKAASAVVDTTTDVWGDLTHFMSRYPFATFFCGLGVGFLLSRLFPGRSIRDFGPEARGPIRPPNSPV